MNRAFSRVLALGVAAAALGLAACNGTNYGSGNNGVPSFHVCTPPGKLQLIYPKNNAVNVGQNEDYIFVASDADLTSPNYQTVLELPSGAFYQTPGTTGAYTAISPSTIPTPHASPGFPNATYYSSDIATQAAPLAANSLLGVAFNNKADPNCQPYVFGSFTTF